MAAAAPSWARPIFLSAHNQRRVAAANALDATVVSKLLELQACVRDLQEERDALHAEVVAGEQERIRRAKASGDLLEAVDARASQILQTLVSLQDQDRDRAALESVVCEMGLKEQAQRLKAVLRATKEECNELNEQLRLADSHALEIEAERRRCKARIMTTEKENGRLSADNLLLERRAKHEGLMLADERTREKRLLEELHLLSSALERTKALEGQQNERTQDLKSDLLGLHPEGHEAQSRGGPLRTRLSRAGSPNSPKMWPTARTSGRGRCKESTVAEDGHFDRHAAEEVQNTLGNDSQEDDGGCSSATRGFVSSISHISHDGTGTRGEVGSIMCSQQEGTGPCSVSARA